MKAEDYLGLVKSIAGKAHRKHGLDYDELVGEGNLMLVICMNKFDPQRGTKFSTYFYHCMQGIIKNMLNDPEECHVSYVPCTDPTIHDPKYFDLDVQSPDAKEVIDIIFNRAEDFDREMERLGRSEHWLRKMTQTSLRVYLRRSLGWNHTRVQNAFNEIISLI